MPPAAVLRARLRAAAGGPRARLRLADQLARDGAGIEAVRHISAAAHDGIPEAQSRLGVCYLRGLGVPANLAEARHWLEQAAAAGDAAAQTELAGLALRGITGPYQRAAFPVPEDATAEPDHHRAAGLARQAAESGSAEAQALLASILCVAPREARTPHEAEALYRAAAGSGSPLGQLGHAITLIRLGADAAFQEARALLLAAAEAGLPTAHFLFAAMTEAGLGGPLCHATAVAHYRIAAEQGITAAKTRLGLALLVGRGAPRNLVEAETWLRRAAMDGDVAACAVLGDFHASPERQPADPEEAARWYRRAAELGHPGAAHVLARAIASGAEGRPDPLQIMNWLEAAIERGDPSAWPDLGGLIAAVLLPSEQLPALHGWLQRMIQEHHPEAGFYVGVCVRCGIGTPPDERLARRYYLWAAGEGVIEAMVAAAEMLLNGTGGRADPDAARALFRYAANHGHVGAHYALGVMAGADQEQAMAHFARAAALGHEKARRRIAASA